MVEPGKALKIKSDNMRTLLSNWNLMRIIRLVLGTVILVQGIIGKDFVSIVFGVLFGGMAVLNMGCCSGGCSVNTSSENEAKNKRL